MMMTMLSFFNVTQFRKKRKRKEKGVCVFVRERKAEKGKRRRFVRENEESGDWRGSQAKKDK